MNACTVLHNICIENNEILPREDDIANNDIDFGIYEPLRIDGNSVVDDDLTAGRRVQQRIINNF